MKRKNSYRDWLVGLREGAESAICHLRMKKLFDAQRFCGDQRCNSRMFEGKLDSDGQKPVRRFRKKSCNGENINSARQ